ncbi:hypothetical protein AUEXF2481DRAFT_535111 [Aureobasidium subglaciale EXF-2481]|uniref:Uncharacterized protein n=1 Tax=Aureobasidium subglaciale (strain EXF-2481) TaxID=1043005 RepID=A0A074Y440_AURSE|nr:uncharacterized protein AUEXF2481DRAFT_535111 [Aureobasidium subglaciale EXF-2481]KEQ90704.1 hypothetical protein AUEXF2481DRAFT_535111 [Aureobasidium subglaciale EXF-2481]
MYRVIDFFISFLPVKAPGHISLALPNNLRENGNKNGEKSEEQDRQETGIDKNEKKKVDILEECKKDME